MLRLVLPKGSLEKATLQLFEDADLAVVRSSDVDYRASIADPRVVDVTVLRPQEIPLYVAQGLFDVGITGRDWIEERSAEVATLAELHYSKATARPIRMVLAVGADSSWKSTSDLPSGVRVHTEYPELTRRFLEKHGIDAQISLSYGATERVALATRTSLKFAHIGKRQPELPSQLHIGKLLQLSFAVFAPTARRLDRLFDQALALIEADGLDADAAAPRHVSNALHGPALVFHRARLSHPYFGTDARPAGL